MTEKTYTVTGMTCGHCVASVSEELSAIDGVTDVSVDLGTGAIRVASTGPLAEESVRDALADAGGYQLATS